jgi:hypothetical protein
MEFIVTIYQKPVALVRVNLRRFWLENLVSVLKQCSLMLA